ncbi:hypothetical protein DSM112329_01140 [Paraconexibacter sp. AEG42_29]|uniref:Uncharacterized protein n=2 Tax=Paraconexibacter sp. AEG42_29 TaxID=2997339 RepID=A0AAU7ARS0_9ACTN
MVPGLHQRRRTAQALLAAFALAVCLCGLLPALASGAGLCLPTGSLVTPASGDAALRFGIYPGGAAGSVEGKPDPAPEDPVARLAALELLRPTNGRLGVHIYTAYTGDAAADEGTALWMDGEIAAYTAAGFDVELVVRYKPEGLARAQAVTGFARFVRATVRRYGGNARFTSLQVTNEANLTGAPDASDGAFAGATDALVAGVIAAKAEVRETNFAQVQVGFNWASDARPAASTAFWKALADQGGAAFADAVDWVGLDAYPGTWFPALDVSSLLPGLAGAALDSALATVRGCHMPAAGLGTDIPIHVSENGYPTGPGRSPATQSRVLEEMVRAVARRAAAYNVSDYNWFDLRDSRSDHPHLESQYGLLRDDYSLKPAFSTYRRLIGELGAGADTSGAPTVQPAANAVTPSASACTRSPARIAVPRRKGWKLRSLRVMQGSRVLKTLRQAAVPAWIRVALKPGRTRVTVRVSTRRGRTLRTQTVRRTLTVCGTTAA